MGCGPSAEQKAAMEKANKYKLEELVDSLPSNETDTLVGDSIKPKIKSGNSYWYVYYKQSTSEGFDVIRLKTPYWDIDAAAKEIEPNGNDWVAFMFFKEVPMETYRTYLKNRAK